MVRYPYLLILGIIGTTIFLILKKRKKSIYKKGIKVANTSIIKEHPYYQKLISKYTKFLKLVKTLCIISIFLCLILIARLSKVDQENQGNYNRDIILCMDISGSVDELNYELVSNLKQVVKSLKGERFGISIFNTSSVPLVPLTDDYDYVLATLDDISAALKISIDGDIMAPEYLKALDFLENGTTEGAETRGSSLIGDGLASCVYSFPTLEQEDRTKIILFSTDNDLAGKPLLTINEAASLANKNKVKVFGIGTKRMTLESNFKKAIEDANGTYFNIKSSSAKEIVNHVEKTSKSLLEKNGPVIEQDIPEIPFILLVICTISLIIISKKVIV